MPILLVLSLLFPAAPAHAEPFAQRESAALRAILAEARTPRVRPATKAPWTLRVLTYNIHGILPWLADPGKQPEAEALGRYREIARRLRERRAQGDAPHIVAIQEAWNDLAARAAKEAGYPYVVAGGSARLGKLGGAGLFIMSEFPILASETADYRDCTGYDCLANKGVLHVRVAVPRFGGAVDVYNTHMNADGSPAKPEDSLAARMAQIETFAAFVRKTRDPASAALLAGDFNFPSSGPDYALFDRLLGAVNASRDCLDSKTCTGDDPGPIWREAIDHQLHLAGSAGALKAAHLARTFAEPHEGKPLSDHLGVEASYLFSR